MNQELIDKLFRDAKDQGFNGQIVFIEHGKRYEYLSGIEDINKHTMLSSRSIFAVASGTKFLTALAIGQLIDQKKFDLESKAKDILDLGFDMYDADVKIKHLLSHTSGLPDYLDESEEDHPLIDNQAIKNVSDYLHYFPNRKMDFKPGTQFKYNNSAFVYLALIIEKVTGISYQKYINEQLLKPLGISKSGIYLTSLDFQDKAMGYVDLKDKKTYIGYIPESSGGDGGAYMHADECYQLFYALMKGHILSKSLTKAFLTPQILANEQQEEWYGYGVWLKKKDQEYIPFVIGVDPGIRMKAYYHGKNDRFSWIVTNIESDVWRLFHQFDIVTLTS